MAKRAKPRDLIEPDNAMYLEQKEEETGAQSMARKLLQPTLKNAVAASAFTGRMIGSELTAPGTADYTRHVQTVVQEAEKGGLAMASQILAAQAVTLDSMFAELARRCALNMGEYVNASERYGRLALKAQSNCRATLEALAKLHQPRVQTVRHVHVNEGGQAVIADQFHNHGGQNQNAESGKQSHATGDAGTSPALPSPDPLRDGVPVSGSEGAEKVPDARRH